MDPVFVWFVLQNAEFHATVSTVINAVQEAHSSFDYCHYRSREENGKRAHLLLILPFAIRLRQTPKRENLITEWSIAASSTVAYELELV